MSFRVMVMGGSGQVGSALGSETDRYQKSNARSSMLRRGGASADELGSSKAVCAVRRATSVAES
jgi:hypothetical protein